MSPLALYIYRCVINLSASVHTLLFFSYCLRYQMVSGMGKALAGSFQASSSNAKKMKMTVGVAPRTPNAYKVFAELSEGAEGALRAMVCRAWSAKNPSGKYIGTEYILSDEQGAAIHCIARNSIAHCVVPKLEVGNIYSINKFTLGPNKELFRVRRNDNFLIHLEGNTVIHKIECDASGYVRYPFELIPIEDIAFNSSKYLIDVIGRVVSLGVIKPTRNGSQYIDFHLLNERGNTVKVTLWGSLCEEIKTRCDNPVTVNVVILPAMNVREFKGAVQLSSTSGTFIYDSCDIPEIASLLQILGEKPLPPPDNSGTLLQLLMLGRGQKGKSDEPSVTLSCRVKIVAVRPRNSWHYYSCGLGGCRKGLTPHTNYFWCDSCEKKIEFPLLRFRLHVDIADSTSTIVATIFDEMAETLVKKKAQSVMESLGEAAADNHLPSDILRLVGTDHTFEIKSHTYYNHGYYESFTVSRVLEYSLDVKAVDSQDGVQINKAAAGFDGLGAGDVVPNHHDLVAPVVGEAFVDGRFVDPADHSGHGGIVNLDATQPAEVDNIAKPASHT